MLPKKFQFILLRAFQVAEKVYLQIHRHTSKEKNGKQKQEATESVLINSQDKLVCDKWEKHQKSERES